MLAGVGGCAGGAGRRGVARLADARATLGRRVAGRLEELGALAPRRRSPRSSIARPRAPAERCSRWPTALQASDVERGAGRGGARRRGPSGCSAVVGLAVPGARDWPLRLAPGRFAAPPPRSGIRAAPGTPRSPRCGSRPSATWSTGATRSTFRMEAIGRRTATLWLRAPGRRRGARGRVARHARARAWSTSGALAERPVRPGHQRHAARRTPSWSASGCRSSSASLTVTAHYPRVPRSRCRAGADRRRHAAAARRHPARDAGRGDRAARGAPERGAPTGRRSTVDGGRFSGSFVPAPSATTGSRSPPRAARRSPGRHGSAADPARGRQRARRRGARARAPTPRAAQPPGRRWSWMSGTTTASRASTSRAGASAGWASSISAATRDVALPRRRRTAPSSPTRSTSPGAGCCPATPCAMSPSPTDNTPGAPDRPLARVRAAPADHERGARGAARGDRGRVEPARLGRRGEPAARAADRRSRAGAAATIRRARTRRTASRSRSRRPSGRRRSRKSQQELMRQAEALKQSLEALRKSAEAAGLGDYGVAARAAGDPRAARSRALARAARAARGAAAGAQGSRRRSRTKEALERLAEAQKELREALERSRELFRRAALEGDLANLSQESKELAQEQRRMEPAGRRQRQRARPPQAERELAARADSLAAALDALGQPMGDSARQARLDAAGDAGPAARPGRCSRRRPRASRGGAPEARQQGEQAAQSLEPLGDQLQQERQGMQQEWRRRSWPRSTRRSRRPAAWRSASSPSRSSCRAAAMPAGRLRAEQGAIEEGVQRLLEQMRKAAGKNALVPPEIGPRSAARSARCSARGRRSRTRHPTRAKAPSRRAARWTRSTPRRTSCCAPAGDVQGAESGSGLAEALERMAELAKQQGGLGQQGAGLLPMAGTGAIREQLRQLGATPARAGRGAAEAQGRRRHARGGRDGRRGEGPGQAARGRPAGPAGGRAAGAAVPPHARRGPHAARARGGRAEGAAEHRRPPTTASICRPRSAPGSRATTTGCGCRPGRSCSSSRPRSGGWWWTISGGCTEARTAMRRRLAGRAGLAWRSRRRLRRGAQDSAMSRAFELERRGNYAAAADAYRSVLAARPADPAALLGLERVLMPLGRSDGHSAAGARRARRRTASPRAAPCIGVALRAWAAADEPDSMRAVAERWAAAAPGDETPYREWGAAALGRRDRAGRQGGVPAGPRAAAPAGRAGRRAGAARRSPTVTSPARCASGCRRSGACPGTGSTAVSTLSQAPDSLRSDAACPISGREHGFPARRLEADLRARWGDPLGALEALQDALPAGSAAAVEALRGLLDQLRTSPGRDGARGRRAGRSSSSPSGAGSADRARIRLEAARAYTAAGERDAARRMLAGIADDRARRDHRRRGVRARWSRSSSAKGSSTRPRRRLAEHRSDMSGDEYATLRRRLVAGLRPGGRPGDAPTRRSRGDSTVDGLALRGRIRLYRGDIAGAHRAVQGGRAVRGGPRRGHRAHRAARAAAADRGRHASRLWARRCSQLEQGDTTRGRRGARAGSAPSCRPPRVGRRCACSPAGSRPRPGRPGDAERLLKAAAAPDAPGHRPGGGAGAGGAAAGPAAVRRRRSPSWST